MKFNIIDLVVEIQYPFILIIAFSMLFSSYDYLFVVLFSALHELGHLLALYLFGGKADKLVLSYYGIGLKHSENFSNIKNVIFLSCGVFVNVLFAIINVKREINISLAIVNALPIYPLDGGRILKLIFNSALNLHLSDVLYKIISVVFIVLLIILSIYIKSFSLAIIVIYIIVYSLNKSID